MIKAIGYRAATVNMGADVTDQDGDNYREWALNELGLKYPHARIVVYNSEMASTCTSDLEDPHEAEQEEYICLSFMADLWIRCPWEGEFFK
jgi:hypothetical protein